MEEELRQAIVQKLCAGGQLLFLGRTGPQNDLAALAKVELLGLEGFEVGHRLGDQGLQVG